MTVEIRETTIATDDVSTIVRLQIADAPLVACFNQFERVW
jgi:hypothetical protein